MPDCNPWLGPEGDKDGDKGGPDGVERPDHVENIPWQTRAVEPSPYENALADALTAIFAAEIYDPPRIAEQLRLKGVPVPGSGKWTEELFLAEMARLGG